MHQWHLIHPISSNSSLYLWRNLNSKHMFFPNLLCIWNWKWIVVLPETRYRFSSIKDYVGIVTYRCLLGYVFNIFQTKRQQKLLYLTIEYIDTFDLIFVLEQKWTSVHFVIFVTPHWVTAYIPLLYTSQYTIDIIYIDNMCI